MTRATGQTARDAQRAERGSETRRESRDARNINDQCQRRARRRGRLIGGLVGGVAGGLVGRDSRNPAAALATALPVSLLLGEAITPAARLPRAGAGGRGDRAGGAAGGSRPSVADGGAQRGVGTTVAWTSETRPGVTGSSTVTASSRSRAAANA